MLVCTLARLRLHFPASQLQCFTYGSPCVLAAAANSMRNPVQVCARPCVHSITHFS